MASTSKTGTDYRPIVDNDIAKPLSSPRNPPSHSNNTLPNINTSKSYSQAAKQFPKKNQAFTFPALPDTKLIDYLIGTAKLIGDKSIFSASRISNGRICLYLDSKEKLDDFIANHGGITIRDTFVPAKRLVAPTKKIIISNVHSCLSDSIILESLKSSGLQPTSNINSLHIRFNNDECKEFDFNHIQTFRKFVYVIEDESTRIPDSIRISFESENYRIFLAGAEMRCFLCKEFGHIASTCDAQLDDQMDMETANNQSEDEQSDTFQSSTSAPTHPNTNEQTDTYETNFPKLAPATKPPKRTLSQTTSESSVPPDPANRINSDQNPSTSDSRTNTPNTRSTSGKQKKKKLKTTKDPVSIRQLLQSIENNYETKLKDGKYSLSFTNFAVLLDSIKGLQDPSSELPNFNLTTAEVIKILDDNYPFLVYRTIKHRFTRLKNKLLGGDSVVSDSESTFSS